VAPVGEELLAAHGFSSDFASLNLRAQSAQQTSTTLAPILTLMAFPSSSQSQAAQVFSAMISSPLAAHFGQAQETISRRQPLSKSLVIF
jgi:hypothetical protein